ncbi:MAG TPA: MATE family efflux transporter [Candidatus Hungatella pullicola]|nr:MATE family efflux transporter [Candidatus Hungatella pullicola]
MEKKQMKDMTSGSPMKLILSFLIPMLFGLLFQQLYNMVDTIIVGKYLGVNALAAVGSTGSINFMIIGFCTGVCSGFSIPVAQKFGEKNEVGLRRFVANGAWLSIAFAVVMTTVVCLLCRKILQWMNTPADIIDGAYAYIFVIFLGIPATYLYNTLSGIIRSLGDSTTPLLFLLISSLLNVALDLFTIIGLGMGVEGAAWATIISQAVSGVLCLIYMTKKFPILRMTGDEWKPDRNAMITLCNMGIPMGLQYSITAIGSVVLQTAVNSLGSVAVASVTAGSKISTFFCCPFDAMGATMATYGGQNVGAKKLSRIKKGMKCCVFLGAVYSIIGFLALYFFSDVVALMFVDGGETEILANTRSFLLVNSAFYIPLALVNIVRFMIQGLGFSKLAIIAGVCEMAARTLVGFIFVPIFGYSAVCFANPVAWLAADLFLIPAYYKVMKQLMHLFVQRPRETKTKAGAKAIAL